MTGAPGIKVRGKFDTFAANNPNSRCYPLVNMGGLVDVGAAHLSLVGYDVGEGTTVIKLIRRNINFSRLDLCASFLGYRGNCDRQKRVLKILSRILDTFHYSFEKAEKSKVMKEAGCITKTSFLEVSEDDQMHCKWLLFHDGAKTLSEIITRVGPDYYLDESLQMEDLQKVQQFAAISRRLVVQRLFGLYYGTYSIEEAAFSIRDFPYHFVDPLRSRIYFAASPANGWSLFLCNIRDGAILYRPEPHLFGQALIGLSGCGKIEKEERKTAETDNYAVLDSLLNTTMAGIYHSHKEAYRKVLPEFYQSASTVLGKQTSKIVLTPIYNYRSR